jgi:hypothetical protein
MRKGQYRIVTEVILFAIGVAITGYIVISFGNIHTTVTELSLKDNMNGVANMIANGLLKASLTENSTVRIEIPDQISKYVYMVSLDDDEITVSTDTEPQVTVVKQLFNMSQNYIISGEAVSSAKFLDVIFDGSNLKIKRSKR